MNKRGRMRGLTIRRAEPADSDELTRCFEAAYAPARARGVRLPPVAEGLDQDIRDHLVWVAEDGSINGGIVLSVVGEAAHLVNVGVDPSCAGSGIGRRLIETVVEHVRACGATRIDLATHVDMPENVSLYKYLGWRETGRHGNKVQMSRHLG